MIQLSTPSDKAVRAQIAESISLIASADFPERWSDLIDVRPKLSSVCSALTKSPRLEPRRFALSHKLCHQHRCITNRTLHLLILAGRYSLRCFVHGHQPRSQELQQAPTTAVTAYLQSSPYQRARRRDIYPRTSCTGSSAARRLVL